MPLAFCSCRGRAQALATPHPRTATALPQVFAFCPLQLWQGYSSGVGNLQQAPRVQFVSTPHAFPVLAAAVAILPPAAVVADILADQFLQTCPLQEEHKALIAAALQSPRWVVAEVFLPSAP